MKSIEKAMKSFNLVAASSFRVRVTIIEKCDLAVWQIQQRHPKYDLAPIPCLTQR